MPDGRGSGSPKPCSVSSSIQHIANRFKSHHTNGTSSPSSSSFPATAAEGGVTSPCDGPFAPARFQCTKSVEVVREVTKNDAQLIPERLLQYLVEHTREGSEWGTAREISDWVVFQLRDRVGTGQAWTIMKVFTVVHELLWRGSQCFAKSLKEHGLSILQFNVVMEHMRNTPQQNLDGQPLKCGANAKHEEMGPRVDLNDGSNDMGKCTYAGCEWGNNSAASRGNHRGRGRAYVNPNEFLDGDSTEVQGRRDFVLNLLGYLEALCEYRVRHPSVDLPRGVEGTEGLEDMTSLKSMCDDTFELLKCIAASTPHIPDISSLPAFIVRRRIADIRPLNKIASNLLVNMLQVLIKRFQHSTEQFRELTLKETFEAARPELLKHKKTTMRLLEDWYHTVYQYDRTMQMLSAYLDQIEENSGERFNVRRHLRTFPPEALAKIRRALREQRSTGDCLGNPNSSCGTSCQGTGSGTTTADGSIAMESERLRFVGGGEALGDSLEVDSAHTLLSNEATVDEDKLKMAKMRDLWQIQVTALLSFYEDTTVPQSLLDTKETIEGVLQQFVDAKTTWMKREKDLLNLSASEAGISEVMTATTTSISERASTDLFQNGEKIIVGDEGQTIRSSYTLVVRKISPNDSSDSTMVKGGGVGGNPHSISSQLCNNAGKEDDGGAIAVSPSARHSGEISPLTSGSNDFMFINMTEEMLRTEQSIEAMLEEEDVVIVCNEPCSCNDRIKLADRFSILRDKPLGSGSFGTVFRAWDELSGCYLAAKEIAIEAGPNHTASLRNALNEYAVLTGLNHPNIVRVVAFMAVKNTGRIFMEWMPSGSILEVLRLHAHGALREAIASQYTHDALAGLAFLHHRSILHRDVKPANMLLTSSGSVKLTDFGTSSVVAGTTLETTVITGTVPYMAPEMAHGLYSAASDIWALGCSVVEMVTGQMPWTDLTTKTKPDSVPLLFKIGSLDDVKNLERPHSQLLASMHLKSGEGLALSPELIDFLEKVFVLNRRGRPTAAELLQHPFITSYKALRTARAEALSEFAVNGAH